MAYLDANVLNDFQAREAINEKRIGNYGMLELAKASTPFIDYIAPSTIEMLRTMSGSRKATIPVIKDQSVTVNTTPGFANIPLNLAEGDSYYFTAYDVFSGFRMYPSSFQNSQIDGEFYRDAVLRNVLQACAATADDIIETVLEARKTQVFNYTQQLSMGDGAFTFDAGSDELRIGKAAQKDTMFTYLAEGMRANQMPGQYRVVTSPGGLLVSTTEAAKYGANNSKNILWDQTALPFDRRYISDQISTSANFNGFLVRDGGLGVVANHPFDFANGTEFAGKQWMVSDAELPYMNMRANVFINKEATEATSLISPNTDTNLKMTHFEEMALWFRFYVIYRYNSDLSSRPNDIVKLVGLTS